MKHSCDKSKFIEILRENPWISFASKKSGISRATIYRWMKDSPDFKVQIDTAMKAGVSQLGEIAEMGLAKKIKEGNFNAIKYYLAHNNQRYVPKRSEYVFPPDHTHYDEPDRCERCGRISAMKEAEIKEKFRKIDEAFKRLSNSKTKKSKQEWERLLKSTLENGKEKTRRRKESK